VLEGFKLEYLDVGERDAARTAWRRQAASGAPAPPSADTQPGTSRNARIRGRMLLSAQPARCRLRSRTVWRSGWRPVEVAGTPRAGCGVSLRAEDCTLGAGPTVHEGSADV
jgi:hypothetical protein